MQIYLFFTIMCILYLLLFQFGKTDKMTIYSPAAVKGLNKYSKEIYKVNRVYKLYNTENTRIILTVNLV